MARKKFSKEFKSKVALAAIRGEKTIAQISSDYGIAATQVNQWKKQALDSLPDLFARKNEAKQVDPLQDPDRLQRMIGQLQVENDWLKKKSKQLGLI